jgi:hypothetical protein
MRDQDLKISIKNSHPNLSRTETKELVQFFADKLITKTKQKNMIINLVYDMDGEEIGSDKGQTLWEWYDTGRKNKFTIHINPKLSKSAAMKVIAHEMVHVKQYAHGELYDYQNNSKVRWMGKVYDEDEFDYWEQPWEVDAYGREVGLVIYYKEHIDLARTQQKFLAKAKRKIDAAAKKKSQKKGP